MSMIAVAARHPLAVDRHALGSREPQLLDDRQDVLPRHEVVAPVAALGHGRRRVRQLDHQARPRHRDEARGHPRVLELAVEGPGHRRPALPRRLEVLDLRAEVEDLLLELLLLRLEVERRRHQRRPLLARDPDPRALGRELGGDQEAEREQRDAERHLPGRDRSDAGGERRHVRWSGSAGARPRGRPRHPPRRAPGPAAPDRSTTSRRWTPAPRPAASRWRRPSPPRRSRPGIRRRASPARRSWARGPTSPTGADRPARAADRTPSGRTAPRSASQPAWNWPRSSPRARLNASSSVSPSAYAVTRATSASWPFWRTR